MQKLRRQLLLLEDVDGLGRSGDLAYAKPGFVRNYLMPRKLAVVADKHTLRMRERLQKTRQERAIGDKKEAEEVAKRICDRTLEIEVKVDPDGHMYGSVSTLDLVHLFKKEGIELERKNFLLPQAIKELGEHSIKMRLKEDIPAEFKLLIKSDIELPKVQKQKIAEEAPPSEAPPVTEGA